MAVFELGDVTIKVAILDDGDRPAGPGERGPMLIEGAPPVAEPAVAKPAAPEPAPAPPPALVEEAPPPAAPPPLPKPDAPKIAERNPEKIIDKKPAAKPALPEQKATASATVRPVPTEKPSPPGVSGESTSPGAAPAAPGAIAGEGGTGRRGGAAMAPAWAPTARASYRDRIKAWVDRYKVYPAMARRRHLEGEGRMSIRIDRSGRVLERNIEKSTGERMLDLAALETVDRASPFPAVPSDYPDATFSFTYPFEFRLR